MKREDEWCQWIVIMALIVLVLICVGILPLIPAPYVPSDPMPVLPPFIPVHPLVQGTRCPTVKLKVLSGLVSTGTVGLVGGG